MSESLPKVRPEAGDDRYTLRLKRRLAQDLAKQAEAGMLEHALVALWELGMGKKVDGTQIGGVEERTRVQALSAYARISSSIAMHDNEQGRTAPSIHFHLSKPDVAQPEPLEAEVVERDEAEGES